MELIKKSIALASYPDKTKKLTVGLLFNPSCAELKGMFRATFKDDIQAGKLTLQEMQGDNIITLVINGIIYWDDVPVTNLYIQYKKDATNKEYGINLVCATLFTFFGKDVISECLNMGSSASVHNLQKNLHYSNKEELSSVSVSWVNALKRFTKTNSSNINIFLHIEPFYSAKCAMAMFDAQIEQKYIGLPIFKHDTVNGPLFTEINCTPKHTDNSHRCLLTKNKNNTYKFCETPLFLHWEYLIEDIIFIPSNRMRGSSDVFEWKEIRMKLADVDVSSLLEDHIIHFAVNATAFRQTHTISYDITTNEIVFRPR